MSVRITHYLHRLISHTTKSVTDLNKKIQKDLLKAMRPKITHQQNQKLTQQITLAELKHAIFQMENTK